MRKIKRNLSSSEKNKKKDESLSGIKFLALIAIVLLFIGGLLLIIFKPVSDYIEHKNAYLEKGNSINIGDIYFFNYHEDNPFEKEYKIYYRVINKKGEYVQYVDTLSNDTLSMKIEYFLMNMDKVKNSKNSEKK